MGSSGAAAGQRTSAGLSPGARRILDTASALFYEHGIHTVGVDTIAARSGITKRTLYDRFGSKDALVTAYLQARHEAWWDDLERRIDRALAPRVLAVFDAYASTGLPSVRGCAFLNAAGELPLDHPGQAVIRAHKTAVRRRLGELLHADHPDLSDRGSLAEHLFLLLEGAIAHRGVDGDDRRLVRARGLAAQLLGDTR
ncbi:TetR/AcrR family transcriptional regulator [Brevibacterium sp. R8603A2]|uniref:TetR/AcrR family transcriptional regulator n=1 Tax=Brevibacterium sp. R8603A2 TaxID=2929779 RepID=UPI001FF850BD|nr:TetR/AcrR family transcriptional regulator [Brevibacterium sp. R8603A2]